MNLFSRFVGNLIGWPALERTPLGVLNPTAGLDDALHRWAASFWDGVPESSPPDTSQARAGHQTSDDGEGETPAEADPEPPAGVSHPIHPLLLAPDDDGLDWEDEFFDDLRRITRAAVWARRDAANANLKVDKFGDVYEDPAQPPGPVSLTIAAISDLIDQLTERVEQLGGHIDKLEQDKRTLRSELRQAVAQRDNARKQRDALYDQLGITHP